jgi:hypothetical protein
VQDAVVGPTKSQNYCRHHSHSWYTLDRQTSERDLEGVINSSAKYTYEYYIWLSSHFALLCQGSISLHLMHESTEDWNIVCIKGLYKIANDVLCSLLSLLEVVLFYETTMS